MAIQTDEKMPAIPAWLTNLLGALVAVATLNGLVGCPYLQATVIEPQQRTQRQVDKLETEISETRAAVVSIDKSLAVMAEAMKHKR